MAVNFGLLLFYLLFLGNEFCCFGVFLLEHRPTFCCVNIQESVCGICFRSLFIIPKYCKLLFLFFCFWVVTSIS